MNTTHTTLLDAKESLEWAGFLVTASAADWTVSLIWKVRDSGLELAGKAYIVGGLDGQETTDSHVDVSLYS